MSEAGEWTPVLTGDGSWTLAHPRHGETCHSRSGAWLEACERHARPCELFDWTRAQGSRPARLLDVGTGLGLNLAAALYALEEGGGVLHAVGLEADRGVIAAALALPHGDAHDAARPDAIRERWHAPVRAALARALAADAPDVRVPLGRRSSLRLLVGDARATIRSLEPGPVFDAVFLDPFSPAREPELWEVGFLEDVARRMAPGALLSTYSAAFAVRLALARAGLRVGLGPRVAKKAEGTLASPDRVLPPLAPRVQGRLAGDPGGILAHRLREGAPGID